MNRPVGWLLWLMMALACSASEIVAWKLPLSRFAWEGLESEGIIYFDRIIRDWDHFANVARYIRRNPLKAQLGDGAYLLKEAPWIQRLLA